MTGRRRIALLASVAMFAIGLLANSTCAGNAADRPVTVMGIVERVSGTDVTVGGNTYDFKGVPIRSAKSGTPVEISSLRGETVEILFRNRNIGSVTVYRTLPQ
jgi:hypothetical protein